MLGLSGLRYLRDAQAGHSPCAESVSMYRGFSDESPRTSRSLLTVDLFTLASVIDWVWPARGGKKNSRGSTTPPGFEQRHQDLVDLTLELQPLAVPRNFLALAVNLKRSQIDVTPGRERVAHRARRIVRFLHGDHSRCHGHSPYYLIDADPSIAFSLTTRESRERSRTSEVFMSIEGCNRNPAQGWGGTGLK